MINGHGGNISEIARMINCPASDIIDMSSNINPLGPPPGLLDFITDNLGIITRLPEVDARSTAEQYGHFIGADPGRLLAGNGTTQFIYALPRVLQSRQALIVGPTYADYADACRLQGVPCQFHIADEPNEFVTDLDEIQKKLPAVDTVFLCNPNNPTGALIPRDALQRLCRRNPRKTFIIDESYLDFVPDAETRTMVHSGLDNVFVLLSLSKLFKIPGLRIGFIFAPKDGIEKFRAHLLPWSVNSLAQLAVEYVVREQKMIETFIDQTRSYITGQREQFHQTLGNIDCYRLFKGWTPFILVKLKQGLSGDLVWQGLVRDKILIRRCANFKGLSDRFIRISLKTNENNRRLLSSLMALVRTAELEIGTRHTVRMAG